MRKTKQTSTWTFTGAGSGRAFLEKYIQNLPLNIFFHSFDWILERKKKENWILSSGIWGWNRILGRTKRGKLCLEFGQKFVEMPKNGWNFEWQFCQSFNFFGTWNNFASKFGPNPAPFPNSPFHIRTNFPSFLPLANDGQIPHYSNFVGATNCWWMRRRWGRRKMGQQQRRRHSMQGEQLPKVIPGKLTKILENELFMEGGGYAWREWIILVIDSADSGKWRY